MVGLVLVISFMSAKLSIPDRDRLNGLPYRQRRGDPSSPAMTKKRDAN
jgi:hypothetical protein